MPYGYTGNILHIDLSSRKHWIEHPEENFYRTYWGSSPIPVYLWINDGKIEIKNATHLWGKDTGETQKIIRGELADDKIRIAQIGPAGENLVRFANIVDELKHFNGRNGLGAL